MSKLLFDKNGIITFSRELASIKEVGINGAIMLQQIHYWIEYNKTEYLRGNSSYIDCYQVGKFWTRNKVETWKEENFPFWSTKTISRIFKDLEEKGFIIVDIFNQKGFDQTRWYTINYEKLNEIEKEIDNNVAKREKEKVRKIQEKNRKKLELQIAREKFLFNETIGNSHMDNLSKCNETECPNDMDNLSKCNETDCPDDMDKLSTTIPKTTTKTTTQITPKESCTTLQDELAMSSEGDGEEVVKLIEKETHLNLTPNMRRKVRKWRIKRVALAIKIFIEKKGERFALLEKIYADDRNFIPNYPNENKKKVDNWNNFQQRQYDYEELEAKLLGWK